MQDKAWIEKVLEELKTERKHQLVVLRKLQTMYDEFRKQGFKVDALLELIATWKQNISSVEEKIRELESLLEPKQNKT